MEKSNVQLFKKINIKSQKKWTTLALKKDENTNKFVKERLTAVKYSIFILKINY